MAEVAGILGTTAGLISQGIQVYGAISKYLEAVKGIQRELDSARRLGDNLKRCIDAISVATSKPSFRNLASRDPLDATLASCQSELVALEALVMRLQGPSAPISTISGRFREKGRKLAFPFHRETMIELEKRLGSAIVVLQTAMQAFGLFIGMDVECAVTSQQALWLIHSVQALHVSPVPNFNANGFAS
ncbi:hypothetical protein CCHR01_08074 [Colletotrichum chrysophilum]|uniref:Fungal N-terminal domain-containing protein n=1 Tax=Colletotrichum chrysophilum TaxID=1836956 RepID=A0AAD9APC3_9PEZI|nr:hypothetical protein CCHR01_08074 [Colletotrichum chrysophilum]